MVKPVIDIGKAENTIQLSPNLSPPRTANQVIVFKGGISPVSVNHQINEISPIGNVLCI
jgi:hypothetical protein